MPFAAAAEMNAEFTYGAFEYSKQTTLNFIKAVEVLIPLLEDKENVLPVTVCRSMLRVICGFGLAENRDLTH